MNKVGDFMDDSTITARVKAALIDIKIFEHRYFRENGE
jgi:osmotically-inducible protein OsmY